MSRKLFRILTILPFLLAGCSGDSHEGPASVSQEVTLEDKVAPIALEKAAEFKYDVVSKGGPSLIKVDDKNHLYVFTLTNSDGNCEIRKYGIDDFQVKSTLIIKKGQGPSEAINPRAFGGNRDLFVVFDIAGMKYLFYDSDFNYKSEIRVKDLGHYNYSGGNVMITADKNYVLDAYKKSEGIWHDNLHSLFKIDLDNGKETLLYQIKAPWKRKTNKKLVVSQPLHFCYINSNIYILNLRDYRLLKMDIEKQVLKDIKVAFKPINVDEFTREKWIATFHRKPRLSKKMDYEEVVYPAVWVIPFGEGILVGRCQDHDTNNKGPVVADYFDAGLNFLGKLEIPAFRGWNHPGVGQSFASRLLYFKDGKFYTVEERSDDEHWIIVWNLKSKNQI